MTSGSDIIISVHYTATVVAAVEAALGIVCVDKALRVTIDKYVS